MVTKSTAAAIDILAQKVSHLARSLRDKGEEVSHSKSLKADGTVVTELDRALATELQHEVRELFPNHAIVCEDGDPAAQTTLSSVRIIRSPVLAIDPLDGTENFVQGLPFYGMSIGAAEWVGETCRPTWGILALPALGKLMVGFEGQVSIYDMFSAARASCTGLREGGAWLVPRWFYGNWPVEFRNLRTTGSSVFDLFFVLSGAACCTFSTAYLWDLLGGLGIGSNLLAVASLKKRAALPVDIASLFHWADGHSPSHAQWKLHEAVVIAKQSALPEIFRTMESNANCDF